MQKDTLAFKIRTAQMDEWILHMANVESFEYNTEVWVEEVISKGMKAQQNTKYLMWLNRLSEKKLLTEHS